ncbi:hypothetical protein ACFWPV_12280 [Streptomyces uncialis]|uniref:hypothetical protein n=1 Tax=Streptomyces uncialis TaxID=1048205 RepID=UPI0036473E82
MSVTGPLCEDFSRALERERADLGDRLADPVLLAGSYGPALAGGDRPRWAGLFVPVGGQRACGYLRVPSVWLPKVLEILGELAPSEFPDPRPCEALSARRQELTAVVWGAEPCAAPVALGGMLGYHPAGAQEFAAGTGCRP